MKKLILIDGNAIVHRAFHALPPLTNSKGEMTNAVHGFFSMLLSVLQSQKPDFLIVCFDREKPTFRQALYAGYQQNRPKMSDDLVPQIELLHKVLEEMGVCVFEIDGFEADDLIGTLSKQATGKDVEVLMVSGDRDLLQLVNEKVKMLAPVVGIKNVILYDGTKVKEKFEIEPSQIIDYKALVGDASDGYPGVSGIGPKTAMNLLNKYQSFENIYKNLKEIDPKTSIKLATDAEQAALAKKLATIDVNSPIKLDFKTCEMLDFKKAGKVLANFGFKTLSARYSKEENLPVRVQKKKTKKEEQLDLL